MLRQRFSFLDLCYLYGNDKIFEGIKIPSNIDKNILISNIINKCDIFQPIYSDLGLLNFKIKLFFETNYKNYERIADTLQIDYAILDNYDRIEEREIVTDKKNSSTNKSNNINIEEVSAFDSSAYQPNNKNSIDDNSENNYTGNEKVIERNRSHGNIGVTTNQTMINEELYLREKNNIYIIIANDFFNEFMLNI